MTERGACRITMDLREHTRWGTRHPWEIARVTALRLLLNRVLEEELTVLDIGCGDGYVSNELFKDTAVTNVTALDINLADEQIREFSARDGNIRYVNDYAEIRTASYDLILLLDVLEHVGDHGRFLREVAENHAAAGGHVVITAPMFPKVFSSHDTYLGHYRRYSLQELVGLADTAGLHCVASGYLFTSLLIARSVSACLQKALRRPLAGSRGVGSWHGGEFITNVIASLLLMDARLSLLLNKMKIKLPGLTGWVLCTKLRS